MAHKSSTNGLRRGMQRQAIAGARLRAPLTENDKYGYQMSMHKTGFVGKRTLIRAEICFRKGKNRDLFAFILLGN